MAPGPPEFVLAGHCVPSALPFPSLRHFRHFRKFLGSLKTIDSSISHCRFVNGQFPMKRNFKIESRVKSWPD